jgi:hypothetical protein
VARYTRRINPKRLKKLKAEAKRPAQIVWGLVFLVWFAFFCYHLYQILT